MRSQRICKHCGESYAWDDDAPPSEHHDGLGCEVKALRLRLDYLTTRSIPILNNHDPSKPVGLFKDGVITLAARTVTHDWIPFGLGYRVLEQQEVDGVVYLLKIEVLELSCSPDFAARSKP